MLGGDFNVIRFSHERKGRCSMNSAMRDFSDWIRQHDLIDLPLSGAMMRRLDRFIVSRDWLDVFPDSIQRILSHPIFFHCPILLESGMEDWVPPFRFEIMWLQEKNFSQCVKHWRGK